MFRNWKVGVKILTGFVVALTLMLAVGGMAIWRLNTINATVTDLSGNLALDERLSHQMVTQVLMARLFANRYVAQPNETELARFDQEFTQLQMLLDQARNAITDPERVKLLEEVTADVDVYRTAFSEIQGLVASRAETVSGEMDAQALLVQQMLDRLNEKAFEAGDSTILYYAGQARSGFERMRLNSAKYLQSGDAQWAERFEARYTETAEAFTVLKNSEGLDPEHVQLIIASADLTDAFADNFRSVKGSFDRQNDLFNNTMNVVGPDARQHAEDMAASVAEDFDAASANANAIVNQAFLIIVVTMVAATLISLALGLVISRAITRPLASAAALSRQIAEVDMHGLLTEMERLAEGDLTGSVAIQAQTLAVQSRDEVGQLGESFNAMIRSLQATGAAFDGMIARLNGMVQDVALNSDSLSAASAQLSSAAGQAGQVTGQISTTIQQVAAGINDQSQSVTRTAHSIDQMSRAIDGVARGAQEQAAAVNQASNITGQILSATQQVAGNAQAVSQNSAAAAESARQGSRTVEKTISGIRAIQQKVNLSAEKVAEMGQRSEQIGAIVETIEEIASQTNLLALNAAIEAARAGEHGKGFAVVADEVRKLAERAGTATKEIGGLIRGIQGTVHEAVAAMQSGSQEVEAGVKLANEAGAALAEILRAAEAVHQQAEQATAAVGRMSASADALVGSMDSVSAVVEENTAATEEMAAGSGEVTRAIETIASVSEENSAAVEEVSASVEEMSAQVEEVAASAGSLAEMAAALQAIVRQFKLNRQAGDGRALPARSQAAHPALGEPSAEWELTPSGNGQH